MREWFWNTSKRDQTTAEQQPGEERAPRESFSCRLMRVQRRAQTWHSDIAYFFRRLRESTDHFLLTAATSALPRRRSEGRRSWSTCDHRRCSTRGGTTDGRGHRSALAASARRR